MSHGGRERHVHLKDMDVMPETIEQRADEPFRAEHGYPSLRQSLRCSRMIVPFKKINSAVVLLKTLLQGDLDEVFGGTWDKGFR